MTTRRKPAKKAAPKTAPKKVDPPAPEPAPEPDMLLVPREPDDEAAIEAHGAPDTQIIQEGDFAGMTYEEVMMQVKAGVEEELGQLSIDGAKAVVDMMLSDVMQVTEFHQGKVSAKQAAINYIQTVLPYAMADISQEPDRPKSLAEAIQEYRRGIK